MVTKKNAIKFLISVKRKYLFTVEIYLSLVSLSSYHIPEDDKNNVTLSSKFTTRFIS